MCDDLRLVRQRWLELTEWDGLFLETINLRDNKACSPEKEIKMEVLDSHLNAHQLSYIVPKEYVKNI